MLYVCADVHGYLDKYEDAVSLLTSASDKLFIIGDVLDRGRDGIQILQDIMKRKNVILIKGNHEAINLETFERLLGCTSKTEQLEIIAEELAISHIGQDETLCDFIELSKMEQLEIINFLHNLPVYVEISVNDDNYILVHGGLPDFDELPIEYYSEEELLSGPHDFDVEHYEDTMIIVGHLPTRYIYGAEPDEIFHGEDTIALDCGLGFGGEKLGVLCLDTGEALYF